MTADHFAVDHNRRVMGTKVLPALQPCKGMSGSVKPFSGACEEACHIGGMLAKVVVGRRGMQSTLRIKHVLAPGLVEPDAQVMLIPFQFCQTCCAEAPWPQKTRAAGQLEPM